jgi:hypothetical protein
VNQDTFVSKATGYGLDGRDFAPGGSREFSFRHHQQTRFGAHKATCKMSGKQLSSEPGILLPLGAGIKDECSFASIHGSSISSLFNDAFSASQTT